MIDVCGEILATYGAHSNDKLLVHYGFICSSLHGGHSPDDDIRLDHLLLPTLSESTRDQLQDVGFLGPYSLLPSTNELCFKTQVAVRAVLLTCNEWEYFLSSGEDLSINHDKDVDDFVRKLLQEHQDEARNNLNEVKALSEGQARSVLVLRWTQIVDAMAAFCQE